MGAGKQRPQIREDPGHEPRAQDLAAGFRLESRHATARDRCHTNPAEWAELCAAGPLLGSVWPEAAGKAACTREALGAARFMPTRSRWLPTLSPQPLSFSVTHL